MIILLHYTYDIYLFILHRNILLVTRNNNKTTILLELIRYIGYAIHIPWSLHQAMVSTYLNVLYVDAYQVKFSMSM